jgi:hypothetical protein
MILDRFLGDATIVSSLPPSIVQILRRISQTPQNERTVVVIAAVVIFALIVDMELSNVADILDGSISSKSGVAAFIVISAIYLIGQYLLLRFSKVMTSELRTRRKDVRFIDSIVSGVQITIIIVFLLIITEITLGGSYDLIILIIVVIISNGYTAVVMLFLFKRLLGYYKSHPDHAVLSYAISGFIISISALVTIFFMVPILLSIPDFVSAETPVFFPTFAHGSILDTLNYAYYILSIISFLSVWVGTVLLLVHYSRKLGKTKFWIVMSLPLAFYLSQIFVVSLQIPFPFGELDTISFIFYYRVIFTISSTLGGLLFAQPFFLVSKIIPHHSDMHRHLIILALGMVLFFVSGSATVYHAPFPPFGLPTVALIGISSYLMFLGLYSSTISLSEDSELYKLVRTSAKEWKFFLKLGDAEVEKTILNKVESVRQAMTKETGITPSVSLNDARDYLVEVLDEMRKDQET